MIGSDARRDCQMTLRLPAMLRRYRPFRTRLATVAVLALLSVAGTLPASERLESEIGAVIHAVDYKTAHWGILAVDLASGQTVFELNPDRLFAPASVTKLFSTAAALDALGADYRFQTPLYRRGEVDSSGILKGDLILVASGDLSMGGRTTSDNRIAFTNSDHTYANGGDKGELTEPDPLAGLNDLARQVASAGIKWVQGNVLVDDRLFDKAGGTGSGPRRLTPIMVNDNLVDVTITPGEKGTMAKVAWRPQSALYHVDVRVETVAAGEPVNTVIHGGSNHSIVVSGTIPAGHKPLLRVYEVSDAAAYARGLLIEALDRAGVIVDASPLTEPAPGALPARDEVARLPRVAQLVSPPFSESARLILKVSHNLHASTLPLLLAAQKGKRTLDDGLHVQHDVLRRLGVDVDTISFGGGAGGAAADLVTPRATIQLLRHMSTRADAQVYKDAMPILGVDGTLSESVASDSPARGKVFAKTGTYYWDNTMNNRVVLTSKALAGTMTTASNRNLAIALFVNNVHLEKAADTARVGKTLGKLCEVIYKCE